ncbi:MAG TPA: hypothetical protein VGO86_05705 [Candidatus Dormibacteraeota bacterium]
MRRGLAVLLVSAAVVACGPGVWISRDDAISRSKAEKGWARGQPAVSGVTRTDAKLMTWPDFMRASQVQSAASYAPPGKQRVWLVAVSGDVHYGPQGAHEHWVIFIYNAVTGAQIGRLLGPFDQTTGEAIGSDWPDLWSSFPNAG